MVPKLERDYVAADLAAVEGILAHLDAEEDAVNRLAFEYRRDEIKKHLEDIEAAPEENAASFALLFGGDPVIGSQGIESEFSAEVLGKFQDIVDTVNASRKRIAIKNFGPIAAKDSSKLHITRTLRGSFGFQLDEIQTSNMSLFSTSLKESVQEVSELMQSFGDPDDKAYLDALESTNKRILDRVREYFELINKNGATWRIVSGSVDREFNRETMSRAMERIEHTSVAQTQEPGLGVLTGILPISHQFEPFAKVILWMFVATRPTSFSWQIDTQAGLAIYLPPSDAKSLIMRRY